MTANTTLARRVRRAILGLCGLCACGDACKFLVILVLGCLFLVFPLASQTGTATLSGTVQDPSAAVVPNAKLRLESEERRFVRETASNQQGIYVLPSIPPGRYVMSAAAPGFMTEKIGDIVLSSGQAATLVVRLQIGQALTEVTVTTAPPLLQTASATVGSAVEARQVRELPLLGRNYTSLLLTLPGVAPVRPADGSQNTLPGIPSVNPAVFGQRQRSNNFTLDAGSNNDFWFDDPLMFPPPEAIAELKLESASSSSAAGKGSGASVNVVTKAGGSAYHGDVWYTARHAALEARQFFAPSVSQFRWHQFGGAAGGPIVSKNSGWYFFGYYEGVRRRQESNFTGLVPTPEQLAGNFRGGGTIYNPFQPTPDGAGRMTRAPFPNNVIPSSFLNATTSKLAKHAYPAPNLAPGQIPGANYLNAGAITHHQDQFSARVDHQFGPNDNFFTRYTQNELRPRSLSLPGFESKQNQLMKSLLASHTHVFGPTFLATIRYGMARRNRTRWVGSIGAAEGSGLLEIFPATDVEEKPLQVMPSFSIQGYASISESVGMPAPSTQHYVDGTSSKTVGRHNFELGGTVYYYKHTSGNATRGGVSFDNLRTGSLTGQGGDAMASFLLGVPVTANRRIGRASSILNHTSYSLYFQESFRVTDKLNLNLGARWDFAAPMFNRLGTGGFYWEEGRYYWNLKNPVTGEAATVPKGVFPPDRNNIAPRIGIVYQVTNSTVVRAAYGIYYDVFSATSQSQQGAGGNWPFTYVETLNNLNSPSENNGIPTALMPNPFPGPPKMVDRPLGIGSQNLNAHKASTRAPYTQQWSLTIQRRFTDTLGLEALYFGSRSIGLTGQIVENVAPVPGPGPIRERLVFPDMPIGFVSNYHNNFKAWYNGFSTKLEKRFSHSLSFQANYTWSKAIDYLDSMSALAGGGGSTNPSRWNAGRFKGPAGFDIPHRFVFNYVFDVPFRTGSAVANAAFANWSVSGITQYDSGTPYGVWISQDWANTGGAGRLYQLPDVVGAPRLANPTPQRWFDTSAFALPARFGPTGNAGRNPLRADGLVKWDFSAYKKWAFDDAKNLEFRAEFFNLFNQTTFGAPEGRIDMGTRFGTVSGTRESGRSIQMGLRLHF